MSQVLTINLHRPQVQKAAVQSTGTVVVELGNDDQLNGTVDMFFEDRYALDDFLRDLRAKVEGLEEPRPWIPADTDYVQARDSIEIFNV